MDTLAVVRIRAEYAHPCRVCLRGSLRYCVGGAICLAHGVEIYCPDKTELTQMLQKLKPTLDATTDYQYASLIMACNDRGDFKKAWEAAEQVLTMR